MKILILIIFLLLAPTEIMANENILCEPIYDMNREINMYGEELIGLKRYGYIVYLDTNGKENLLVSSYELFKEDIGKIVGEGNLHDFLTIYPFSEGVSLITLDNGEDYSLAGVDNKGNTKFIFRGYKLLSKIYNGEFIISDKDGNVYLANINGGHKKINQFLEDEFVYFDGAYVLNNKIYNNKFEIIFENPNIILKDKNFVLCLDNGLFTIYDLSNKNIVIDNLENIWIANDNRFIFNDLILGKMDKWCYINLKGEIIKEFPDIVYPPVGDKIIIKENSKYGILNKDYTIYKEPVYEDISYVYKDNYIGKKGGYLYNDKIPLDFDSIFTLDIGNPSIIMYEKDDKYGLFSLGEKTGNRQNIFVKEKKLNSPYIRVNSEVYIPINELVTTLGGSIDKNTYKYKNKEIIYNMENYIYNGKISEYNYFRRPFIYEEVLYISLEDFKTFSGIIYEIDKDLIIK